MVEIRLDDDLYTYDGEFKNALIFVLDSEEPTLRQTYDEFKDYTDEDLMEYIETEFDVKPELIVNRKLDSRWTFKSHILED
ncbi:TPA: hypothetical protein VBA44_000950 [Streptococcus agalactiae]|nr:hypothetical protein [Streptococcus agalactiae]HEO6605962.1 hypothetical protein [Streptococcus agalactiae]HEO6631646.1 hypothetical protein [Streptococcus agalactiae]